MLDIERLTEELIVLRDQKGFSQRDIAKKIGVSHSKVQDFENRKTGIWVGELLAWIEACEVNPASWLAQFLSDTEVRTVGENRKFLTLVRRSLRMPERRAAIEPLLKMWMKADDESLEKRATTPQKPPDAQQGGRSSQ